MVHLAQKLDGKFSKQHNFNAFVDLQSIKENNLTNRSCALRLSQKVSSQKNDTLAHQTPRIHSGSLIITRKS